MQSMKLSPYFWLFTLIFCWKTGDINTSEASKGEDTDDDQCLGHIRVPAPEPSWPELEKLYLQKFGPPPPASTPEPDMPVAPTAALNRTQVGNVSCGIHAQNADLTSINETQAPDPKLFPWIVYIAGKTLVCPGVLISPDFVLTSGKCAQQPAQLFFGVKDIQVYPASSLQRLPASSAVQDPTEQQVPVDLGLVKLVEPVDLSDEVRPACVPESGYKFHRNQCHVVNYGSYDTAKGELSSKMTIIPVTVLQQYECRFRAALENIRLEDSHLCVQFPGPGSGHSKCAVDTASVVLCGFDGVFHVVAVSSGVSSHCMGSLVPDIFTSVAEFSSWVQEVTSPEPSPELTLPEDFRED